LGLHIQPNQKQLQQARFRPSVAGWKASAAQTGYCLKAVLGCADHRQMIKFNVSIKIGSISIAGWLQHRRQSKSKTDRQFQAG
jgi:hypothetical protein